MSIKAIVEYNNKGFMIYADAFPGAFTRGKDKDEALSKLPNEVELYCRWADKPYPSSSTVNVIQEEFKDISIEDADSKVIFNTEKQPLNVMDYYTLKSLIFKSAEDVLTVFNSIPEKDKPLMPQRKTFYGDAPLTAISILSHINTVTEYYIKQVGVPFDNVQDLLMNRELAFSFLEEKPDFLESKASIGSFGEEWSLRKVLRRFIWHDRIHVKAMFRRANLIWEGHIKNPFLFTI